MEKVKKLRTRDEIPQRDKWQVEKIYENVDQWNNDFEDLKKEALNLKDFQGKLNNSKTILDYLSLSEKVERKAEKLMVYAHLRSDEDTANVEFQVLKNKIDGYLAELGSYTAFFVPEILSLKDGTIEEFIKEEPKLLDYKFFFEDILKEKPHILSKEMEELMASVSDCLSAPQNIYGILTNAEMNFKSIKNENGEEVELTEGNYNNYIKNKNREVRKEAFQSLFGEYKKFENTIATSLTSSIKNFIFNSKTRKYKNSLDASLSPNNIPTEVYYNAIETIDKKLPSLHRYVDIKKKLLGLDEIHMYDLYVPVVEIEKEDIAFPKAVEMVEEGLRPLGDEYISLFKKGINNGWIDIYENKGKRGGAYSWGCYDTMPYVLLNYNYELNDVSTLAHEMGHSIHSYYSKENQPFHYSQYTLFCAEVASTTNEILLIHHLIEKEKDDKKKLFLINQELEQIRTTVFRQLMFAEFELITHEKIEGGTPLSSKDLDNIWHDLNVKFFGKDIIIDSEIDVEWARIPHFYRDFYVYQYATGYSAASAFANSILDKKENAVEKYKGFLKAGGSNYPIDILKNAGVDMTTSKPLEATINRFDELLDMLEKIIK
ncbi:oligoendopeptidase F [Clostridium fallax]|uniref:Oligopeptidase F n=1 Tax=Clostridium fallax TaxID=1533 RepID=A0A1M4Y8N0_9CLOT|nr:oligoendopeptidase F [Clostridium fallax]SHF02068.1 oligoendopeptidase F [Clostridium fallax]SQB06024.1 oligoendopeptidase F [Clostridium fallax]